MNGAAGRSDTGWLEGGVPAASGPSGQELTRDASARGIQNQWSAVALVAILTVAATLRLGGIGEVGIRFDDEGAYVGDARLWHRCARLLLDGQALRAIADRDKPAFQARVAAHGVDFGARYAKPSQGYTFLGAVAMFAVGDRPAALFMINAVAGVITVALVYAIGALLFSRPVALCAALFLAVSPYHVLYGRSAMVDSTACCLVALGCLVWLRGIVQGRPARRTYLLSGLIFGYAATCHVRGIYAAGVLVLVELMTALWHRRAAVEPVKHLGRGMTRWGWFALGLALPTMAIEAVFQVGRAAAAVSDSHLPLMTYCEAWAEWFRFGRAYFAVDATRTAGLFGVSGVAYIGYLLERHGALALGLTAIGTIIGLLSRGPARFPALMVLVTFALLWSQPGVMARSLSTALPALCLCAAAGIAGIAALFRRRPQLQAISAVLLLLVVAAPCTEASLRLCRERSSVADACRFVAARGPAEAAIGVDTYHRSKYWLYLEGAGVSLSSGRLDREGTPAEVLRRLRGEGVRWFIMDAERWHFREYPEGPRNRLFEWWEEMDRRLAAEAYIAAEFPHVSGMAREFLAEGPGTAFADEMIARQGGRLTVYDLRPDMDGGAATTASFQPERVR